MKMRQIAIDWSLRGAHVEEIEDMLTLFEIEVNAGRMLARDKTNVAAEIGNWQVIISDDKVVGCVSLVYYNPKLCEIRSLAVDPAFRNIGLGKKLIESIVELAKMNGVEEVFTLTRAPGVFEAIGFHQNHISNFPDKVQHDCKPCPFINCCDEITLSIEID
ncbi:MAG: GNAT family N-acetyltransferase [Anaerolineaceae bacterium]|nr:GNAT family N-acetyltransferase [Anaerolineaceae bacterium]